MAIPESQLRTWANQGAVQTSASTHKTVSNCIDKVNWNSDVDYVTYLQGSYPNFTNIHGRSDVDLIVEFRSIFTRNISKLSAEERELYNSDFEKAKYSLASFKKEVVAQLKLCFGAENIEIGDKAIVVKGNGNRLDCDVVVCNPYRNFNSYSKTKKDDYIEGILFKTEHTQKTIINYPKVHIKNGANKNKQENTRGNYKPSIRVLKNMKARMVERGYISKDTAPSYFLECLLYNSNNSNFRTSSLQDIAVNIINQFDSDFNKDLMKDYLVQNEQRNLFGTEDQQWEVPKAGAFIKQLIKFWNEY